MKNKRLSSLERQAGAAGDVANALWRDSRIRVGLGLERALFADAERNGRKFPTQRQAELLVCGNENGAVPAKLKKLFPKLNRLLKDLYQ